MTPATCDAVDAPDGPHTLTWIAPDFAHCPGCDLLYVKQPGVLVWVYDPWAGRLAELALAWRARCRMAALGVDPAALAALDLPD